MKFIFKICAAGKEEAVIRRVPHYYKDFHCIAGECKDNCCVGGWEIDIDDEIAKYYLELPGKFGDRLRDNITRTDEYCFKLKNGKCPFLDDRNLCEIYQELGEDKLGVVCTQFPRYTEYYGNVKETGIGLACEEAERIIFSDKEAFSLAVEEIAEQEVEDSEYDKELAEELFSLREYIFGLIENKELSIPEKLIILLNICHKAQDCINNGCHVSQSGNMLSKNSYTEISRLCEVPYEAAKAEYIKANYPKQDLQEGIEHVLYAYEELEVLGDEWNEQLDMIFDTLHSDTLTTKEYKEQYAEFLAAVKDRAYEYENLIKYYVFRYFMKAAYDHDVFGKAQMIVSNVFVITDMDIVRWIKNNKQFSFQDRIDTVHIFSREVEYSQDNMINLAEEFLFDDIFALENLCGLLFEFIQ